MSAAPPNGTGAASDGTAATPSIPGTLVGVSATSSTAAKHPDAGLTDVVATDCDPPAAVIDLSEWKLTLPVGDADGDALEVRQPALTEYQLPPYFSTSEDCSSVVFRAPVSAATTTGSTYPRSELREMTGSGAAAAWSSGTGVHVLRVDMAFTRLPNDKPHVVGMQIHDANDDIIVFRLEGSSLWLTNGDETHWALVTDQYRLGTRFRGGFEVAGGHVKAFYNDSLIGTLTSDFEGAYFKVGAYTQANCTRSAPCSESNHGETRVYGIELDHR